MVISNKVVVMLMNVVIRLKWFVVKLISVGLVRMLVKFSVEMVVMVSVLGMWVWWLVSENSVGVMLV